MKLSTRGRYGVRLMFDLALHYGDGPIFLKDIAERQGDLREVPLAADQPLEDDGSRQLHAGGARRLCPGERRRRRISLKEILQVLEGSLCLVDCVDNPSLCERSPSCISRDIWEEASKSMQQTLENTTLAAMV